MIASLRLKLLSAAISAATAGGFCTPVFAQQDASVEDGTQVLNRGPIHEAFAESVQLEPQPGIEITKEPPQAVEELPPDQKPDGQNVVWVPGYWAWDDDRKDFIWLSGIWRDIPPGRQWVPGYWSPTDRGFQWITGYWADTSVTEVQYLPTPPESLEEGPSSPPPSANYIWLPGCWLWRDARYVWRPGTWFEPEPNWTWTPAHYCWTPRGCVFVQGYWDYEVAQRGLLFAPVYFQPNVYARPNFSYTPYSVVNTALLTSHLFLRPNYCHYYFGDYYAPSYAGLGFQPWFQYYQNRKAYDPIYAHYRWQNSRQNPRWEQQVRRDYEYRRDHEDARPPHSYRPDQGPREGRDRDRDYMVTPFTQFVKTQDHAQQFQKLNDRERREFSNLQRDVRDFREQRQKLETLVGARPDRYTKEIPRIKQPKSPFVAFQDRGRPDGGRGSELEQRLRVNPDNPNDPDRRPGNDDAGRPRLDRPRVDPGFDVPDGPRVDRPNRTDRPDRPNVPDRPRVDPGFDVPDGPRGDRPNRTDRPNLPDRPNVPDRPRVDPGFDVPNDGPRTDRPARTDRPDRPRVDPGADLPLNGPVGRDRPNDRDNDRTPRVDRDPPKLDTPRPEVPKPAVPTPRLDRDLTPKNDRDLTPKDRNPMPRLDRDLTPKVDRNPLTPRSDREPPKVDRNPLPGVNRDVPRVNTPRPEVPKREEPKVTPRPEPRIQQPRIAPRPEPKIERPQPAPRAAPEPRVDRNPAPRVAPMPTPTPPARPTPPAPRPDAGNKGKGNDKKN